MKNYLKNIIKTTIKNILVAPVTCCYEINKNKIPFLKCIVYIILNNLWSWRVNYYLHKRILSLNLRPCFESSSDSLQEERFGVDSSNWGKIIQSPKVMASFSSQWRFISGIVCVTTRENYNHNVYSIKSNSFNK